MKSFKFLKMVFKISKVLICAAALLALLGCAVWLAGEQLRASAAYWLFKSAVISLLLSGLIFAITDFFVSRLIEKLPKNRPFKLFEPSNVMQIFLFVFDLLFVLLAVYILLTPKDLLEPIYKEIFDYFIWVFVLFIGIRNWMNLRVFLANEEFIKSALAADKNC